MIFLKCFDFISSLEMQANLIQGCCTKIGFATAHVFISVKRNVGLEYLFSNPFCWKDVVATTIKHDDGAAH